MVTLETSNEPTTLSKKAKDVVVLVVVPTNVCVPLASDVNVLGVAEAANWLLLSEANLTLGVIEPTSFETVRVMLISAPAGID